MRLRSSCVSESPIVEFMLSVILYVLLTCDPSSAKGTNPAIKEIFMGRCEDFKLLNVNKLADLSELSSKNCTELWYLFSIVWKNKLPCSVTPNEYKEFVDAAAISIPIDMVNFWDGWDIYDTVRAYAQEGQRSWTLDYTLVGYLINGMIFCGRDGGDGIDYDTCPDEGECTFAMGSMDAFWAQASTYFSMSANGVGKIFFNSSRFGGAFQAKDSYFAEFELKNLTPEKITRLDIYVLTDVAQPSVDDCKSDSILELMSILDGKNIEYTCWENPSDAFHQMCIDYKDHEDCAFLSDDSTTVIPTTFIVYLTTLIALILILRDRI